MKTIVRTAFRSAIDSLQSEVQLMPLSRWTESVLRYFFCRFLAAAHSDVQQFVECGKIDLVLSREPERAFIEFKFYRHPRRFDPYTGTLRGFKGGPGAKNLREFQKCIDDLHGRPLSRGLSKFVALFYADPTDGTQRLSRFSKQYDDYRHPRADVKLELIDSCEPIRTAEDMVRAHLYEVR